MSRSEPARRQGPSEGSGYQAVRPSESSWVLTWDFLRVRGRQGTGMKQCLHGGCECLWLASLGGFWLLSARVGH